MTYYIGTGQRDEMSPYEYWREQAQQRQRDLQYPDPVERAVANSPPECPDLDQGPTSPDELAARERQDARQDIADLLSRRHETHGSFDDNARIAQTLRDFYRKQPGWLVLSFREREALDQIAGKLSRILSSGRGMREHMEDVAGYATLAATPELQR